MTVDDVILKRGELMGLDKFVESFQLEINKGEAAARKVSSAPNGD